MSWSLSNYLAMKASGWGISPSDKNSKEGPSEYIARNVYRGWGSPSALATIKSS